MKTRTKHTPGEWAVSNAGPDQALHIYERATGDVLAVMPVFNCKRSIEDANLMATSPELYECLKDLFLNHELKISPQLRDRIESALLKAEGREK